MASNQHRNLTGEQLHNPKGFDGASPSTTLTKNAAGEIEWVGNSNFDNALDYVSPQSAPPTEVQDDIYLLDDTGVVYDIDTIAWQSGNTIRYTFNGTPNLSAITAGDYLVTSGNGNAVNDGTFIISAVDDGLDYIEITNALRSDATDDEASDAVGTAYYTLGEWDGASKGSHIKFDGTNWNSINAQDGAICYDETSNSHRIYDAANTNWDSSLSTATGISGSGTADYVARFTPDGSTLGNSVIQDNGSTVGINTSPLAETDLTTSRTSAASTASANIVTSISGSNTNTTKGIDITASNTSSGTVWGTQADISTSGTSNLVGHEVLIDTSGSGTITANAAYYVNQLDAGGTTTVSNAYGFLSDGVGGAGTTTNAYHVYLTAHSSGTNKYGIYQAGASDENFFAGDTTIGQLKFDASQTVTASEDNYVLTYDHSTGKISLEASAGGGGGSPWTDTGSSISYSGHGDYVEFKTDYFQIAPTNTSNTLGTFHNQSVYIGTGITAGGGSGSVTRVYAQGQNHTLAGTANLLDSFILGTTHTIAQGNRSFVIGESINIGDVDNSFIGGNTINGSTAVLDGSFIWNAATTTMNLNDTSSGLILLGKSASGFDGDNIVGIGGDHYSADATLSQHYAFGDRIRGRASRQTIIGMGTDAGSMLQLASSSAANGVHLGVASTRPSFGLVKATAKSMTATATETTGLAYLGTGLPVALNVANTGDGAFWIEDVDTAPTANVANAGALYNNSGSLTWWDGTTAHNLTTESLVVAVSDETTALTTGTNKITFRMPYAFTLTEVRASLTTAGTTSGTTTVDINEAGVSILSTKLTIDFSEKTSTTAATAAVISDSALADDAEITVDIDAISGGATEAGLKIYLIGNRA